MTAPKPRCPECNGQFYNTAILAMHRKTKHGVEGTSKSTANAKALKARQESQRSCPHCPQTFSGPQAAQSLGKHLRSAHGIQGKGADAIRRAEAKAAKLAVAAGGTPVPPIPVVSNGAGLHCPDCGFVAKSKVGLGTHRAMHRRAANRATATENPSPSVALIPTPRGHEVERTAKATSRRIPARQPEHHYQADAVAGDIPEATLALALGRFQGLCQSIATEHDLPPRRFAAQLAALIYATTLR